MGRTSLAPVLHFLQTHLGRSAAGPEADDCLLERFAFEGDDAAFEELVKRHAALVWGVCRRVLRNEQDIQDAFQATFLVLVRKAATIRKKASVASWLHGVARHVALKAHASALRRLSHERDERPGGQTDAGAEASYREVRAILDEELLHLPKRFRTPLLLCCLEGLTKAEAAKQLGWKEGTVASRLARARQRLQGRLTRRGITLAAGPVGLLLAEEASAAVPAVLAAGTIRMAVLFAAGEAITGIVPTTVALLTKGILNTMALSKLKAGAALVMTACALFAGAGWAAHQVLANKPAEEQRKDEPKSAAKKAETPKTEQAKLAKKDFYGDPLPPGALARMGTVQLRHCYADIRFSTDGKTLISAGGDGVIGFWDVANGNLVEQKVLENLDLSPFHNITGEQSLSADGKTLVRYRWGSPLRIFEVATGKESCSIPTGKSGVYRAALSPDGKNLAALIEGPKNRSVSLWDAKTGLERLVLDKKVSGAELAFSCDGKVLGVAGTKDLQLWDAMTGVELVTIPVQARCLGFSPDGKHVATGNDGLVTMWVTATGTKQASLRSSIESNISKLAFSPDGKLLVAGGQRALTLWDVAARKEIRQLAPPLEGWVSFSPDSKTVASSGLSSIRLWDVKTGKQLHQRNGHLCEVDSLAVSPDSKIIASTAKAENTLRLWDAATGKPVHVFDNLNWNIHNCEFSSDGKLVICAKSDGALHFWDVETGKEARKLSFIDLDRKSADVQIIRFGLSADDNRLAAIGYVMGMAGYQLNVWDVATGRVVVTRQMKEVSDFIFSPDGMNLATQNRKGIVLQDLKTGVERVSIPGGFRYYFIRFSPDSKILAIASSDLTAEAPKTTGQGIRLVDVTTGKTLSLIPTGPVGQLAFSSDGRMLATADRDALRILEISTGKELFQIKRPENFHGIEYDSFVRCLAFMPNGRALVTGMVDSTILIWDLTPWEQLPKKLPRDLDQKTLADLWSDVGDEASKAYRAIWTLADSPTSALAFLKDHLKPAQEPDPKHVQRLLADLDSDQFVTRDKAAKELAKLGEQIEPSLRKALEGQPSEEVRRQVKAILDAPRAVPSGETLRTLRAIQVLERIGTPEARDVLKKLAAGAAAARETREALESLERLARKAK